MPLSQEGTANPSAAVLKEEEEEASDKGSESDEGEANKDSPSERDEDSDKQSDTEVDEVAGDDEEVGKLLLIYLDIRYSSVQEPRLVSFSDFKSESQAIDW